MILGLYRTYSQKLRIRWNPIAFARSIGVRVGDGCRLLAVTLDTFGSEPYLISLGNHVSITGGVKFITHDGGVWVFREKEPNIELFGTITVKDNVFIGMNCTILPGVTIGENSIIGAGAVVTKDVTSNSVVVGVPARVLCTVDEYRRKIDGRVFNIRDLNQSEKRRVLAEHFGLGRD